VVKQWFSHGKPCPFQEQVLPWGNSAAKLLVVQNVKTVKNTV